MNHITNLQRVLESNPDLCAWGLAYEHCRVRNNTARRPIDPAHFKLCIEWLKLCVRRKTVNVSIGTSYTLKHYAEEWAGTYVTNGAFIAAVIHLGIPYKRYWDSPNIHVALSSKQLPASDSTRFGGRILYHRRREVGA